MSESFYEIRVGDEDVEMTRDNTKLYRHLGAAAMFDHLFVKTGEESGAYMWAHHSQFEYVLEKATEAQIVMYLNLPEAADCDVNAYVRHQTGDLADFQIPEEWIEG